MLVSAHNCTHQSVVHVALQGAVAPKTQTERNEFTKLSAEQDSEQQFVTTTAAFTLRWTGNIVFPTSSIEKESVVVSSEVIYSNVISLPSLLSRPQFWLQSGSFTHCGSNWLSHPKQIFFPCENLELSEKGQIRTCQTPWVSCWSFSLGIGTHDFEP